jgi:predicted O-methyltransferase YrrM
MGARAVWTGEQGFTVEGVTYRSVPYLPTERSAAHDDLVILKDRAQVAFYEELVERTRPRTIVEVGIYSGGSTALLAQLAEPDVLVAVDLRPDCEPLERFIATHDLGARVRPHYGVDQTDGPRLDAILAAELGDAPVDLVIDDASHLDGHTRATFNRLFPHLRPGGLFVIEDWAWAHHHQPHPDPGYQGVTPMSALVCELVLACASRPKVVGEVRVDKYGAVVERGVAALRSDRFDISSRFDPVGRDMVERMSEARSLRAGEPAS